MDSIISSYLKLTRDATYQNELAALPAATNVLDWVYGKDFMALPFKLSATQARLLTQATGEFCHDCSDSSLRARVLDISPERFDELSVIRRNGVCPRCTTTIADYANPIHTVIVVAGQRSGKTLLATIAAGYLLHNILSVPNWAELNDLLCYGDDRGYVQDVNYSVVAVTATSAKKIISYFLQEQLRPTIWFRKFSALQRKCASAKKLPNPIVLRDYALFSASALTLHATTPQYRTLRGRTRFGGLIEDAEWLAETPTKIGAEGVAMAMNRSMLTLLAKWRALCSAPGSNPRLLRCKPLLWVNSGRNDNDCPGLALALKNEGTPGVLTCLASTAQMNPGMRDTLMQLETVARATGRHSAFIRDFGDPTVSIAEGASVVKG